MYLRKFFTLAILLLFVFQQQAFATNGVRLIGNGSAAPVMGGTGVVEPQDTGAIFINPASVTKLEPRVDISTEMGLIDLRRDTSAAANSSFRNTYGEHNSEGRFLPLPSFGWTNQLNDSLYYGVAGGVSSGLVADFKQSRISPAITGNLFDKHIEGGTFEILPTIAYKQPDSKLAVGFSPSFNISWLQSDLTRADFNVTNGNDHTHFALGFGFNLGLTYDINEYLSAGASFISMRWKDRYDEYNDHIDRLNDPPIYVLGLAYKPNEKFLFETDVKWYHWRWVDVLGKTPGDGGFGWKNQWVFGFGTQYQVTDKLKLRLGYNYGKSPIKENVIFANAASPLISEHHLGLGISYQVTEKMNFDFGWLHSFRNKMVDNGQGDTYSVNGAGTRVRLSIDSLIIGIGYKL